MSPATLEPLPRTRSRLPSCPSPGAEAARRARARRARRDLLAFPCGNPHQRKLRNVALAMVGYMEEHWCAAGHEYDFDRWWQVVAYYARVLASPDLAGRRAARTVEEVLAQDQLHPREL